MENYIKKLLRTCSKVDNIKNSFNFFFFLKIIIKKFIQFKKKIIIMQKLFTIK